MYFIVFSHLVHFEFVGTKIFPTISYDFLAHVTYCYQPKVTTLEFVLVRVIALKPAPTLNTVRHDKYKTLVLKNTARLMLVVLPLHQLATA